VHLIHVTFNLAGAALGTAGAAAGTEATPLSALTAGGWAESAILALGIGCAVALSYLVLTALPTLWTVWQPKARS
jgi:hypothetical protein